MSAPGSPFKQRRSSFKGPNTTNVSSPKAEMVSRGNSSGSVRRNASTSGASQATVTNKPAGKGNAAAKDDKPGNDTVREDDGSDDEAEAQASAPAQPAKKKWKKVRIAANLSACKYDVLRMVLAELKWKEVGDESDWHVYWTDTSVSLERVMRLAPYQRINHFHGMLDICRKKPLARNIGRLRTLYPVEYGYTPRTFVLPGEMQEFLAQFNSKKTKTYILKPDAGCQGKGISLAQSAAEVVRNLDAIGSQNVVAQRYLSKPLLINGFKFDMRIYTLTTSVDPLRVYVYREGLARFCTSKYVKPRPDNLDKVFMHLTNYAINKHNEEFHFATGTESSEDDSKWSMTKLLQHLHKSHGVEPEAMWMSIADLVVKTIIIVVPQLIFNYRTSGVHDASSSVYGSQCFELLGFDIMLDEKLRPWLIEVNHSPSFTVDTPLDLAIKKALICDTLRMVIDTKAVGRLKSEEKETLASRLYAAKQRGGTPGKEDEDARERQRAQKEGVQQKRDKMELANLGNYFPAYPLPDEAKMAKYAELLAAADKVFHDYSYQMKVRNTLDKTRQARVEMDKQQDEKMKARVGGTKAAAAAAVAAAGSAAPAWLRHTSTDPPPPGAAAASSSSLPWAPLSSSSADPGTAGATAGVAAMSLNDYRDDKDAAMTASLQGSRAAAVLAAAPAVVKETTGGGIARSAAGGARVHVPSLHFPDIEGAGELSVSHAGASEQQQQQQQQQQSQQQIPPHHDDDDDASMNDSDDELPRRGPVVMSSSARGAGMADRDDASSVHGGSDEEVEGEYHGGGDSWRPGASFPGAARAPGWGHDLEELGGEEEQMEEEEEEEEEEHQYPARYTAPLLHQQGQTVMMPEIEGKREADRVEPCPKAQSAEVLSILTSMLGGNGAANNSNTNNNSSNNSNYSTNSKGAAGKPPSAPSSFSHNIGASTLAAHHRAEPAVTHVAVKCSPQHAKDPAGNAGSHPRGGVPAGPTPSGSGNAGHHHGALRASSFSGSSGGTTSGSSGGEQVTAAGGSSVNDRLSHAGEGGADASAGPIRPPRPGTATSAPSSLMPPGSEVHGSTMVGEGGRRPPVSGSLADARRSSGEQRGKPLTPTRSVSGSTTSPFAAAPVAQHRRLSHTDAGSERKGDADQVGRGGPVPMVQGHSGPRTPPRNPSGGIVPSLQGERVSLKVRSSGQGLPPSEGGI